MSKLLHYLIPFLFYLLTPPALESAGFPQYAYLAKVLAVGAALAVFWKSYGLSFKGDKGKKKKRAKGQNSGLHLLTSFIIGILIFLLWILIEQFMPYPSDFNPSTLNIAFKLLGGILVAPLVEELFTRGFLLRFLIDPDNWDKTVPMFTWFSFIVTALFFGFSHNRWLAGILVGIILNAVYIKTKRIENCIIAHAAANACLAIYVISTGNYSFW